MRDRFVRGQRWYQMLMHVDSTMRSLTNKKKTFHHWAMPQHLLRDQNILFRWTPAMLCALAICIIIMLMHIAGVFSGGITSKLMMHSLARAGVFVCDSMDRVAGKSVHNCNRGRRRAATLPPFARMPFSVLDAEYALNAITRMCAQLQCVPVLGDAHDPAHYIDNH